MSEDHTAEREAFEAWYSAEDQETDDPERTYELTEEGMNELTKYCVWQGWQARAAAPAQERIQALELEVRQLTEQIAELRHAPTPQADSQPAPVLVYPPLPEPFIGVRNQPWVGHAEVIRSAIGEDGVIPCFTAGQMVAYADATHAARAPADSVLEDAARYRWLAWRSDTNPIMAYNVEMRRLYHGYECDAAIDAAIAARKQGANHD